MSDTIGGRVTGSDAEGPVTMPEGTGVGVGERASEQSFSAREMPETISLLVLAGAGDDGEPASSRVRFSRRSSRDRFLTERAGGAGMEAAVA